MHCAIWRHDNKSVQPGAALPARVVDVEREALPAEAVLMRGEVGLYHF